MDENGNLKSRREVVIGYDVSTRVMEDNMDVAATLILSTCNSLDFLRMSTSLLPFPASLAAVSHISIHGESPDELVPPAVFSYSQRLSHPDKVTYVSLHKLSINPEEVSLIVSEFPNIKKIRFDQCPRITKDAFDKLCLDFPKISFVDC